MSDLIAVAYPDRETAEKVRLELARLTREHVIEIEDAVVATREPNGRIKLHQTVNPAGAGAAGGALWGGLIGLIFFAPLFGMAIGAAAGAAAGAMSDAGVDDKFMKRLGTELESGGAALILLVRQANMEKILAEVEVPGEVIQTSLNSDTEQALRDALATAGASAV
jgi:uncharacterized membrane protein